MLAALVFQEKNASAPSFESAPDVRDACASALDLAARAGEIQKSEGLPIDPNEFAAGCLKFGLSEVVHEWAKGAAFADVCALTDVQEGSIVRTITRLDEMTRDVRNAARIMGDSACSRRWNSPAPRSSVTLCFPRACTSRGPSEGTLF